MNTDPTPKIELIPTLMDRSPERHPEHPWKKEIAELRYDLQHRDGFTAPLRDVAKALAISPQDVRDLQNGGKTTTPEGWAVFECVVRAEHAKAGAERAARAQGLRMAAPMLTIAALVLALLTAVGCGDSACWAPSAGPGSGQGGGPIVPGPTGGLGDNAGGAGSGGQAPADDAEPCPESETWLCHGKQSCTCQKSDPPGAERFCSYERGKGPTLQHALSAWIDACEKHMQSLNEGWCACAPMRDRYTCQKL